MIKCINHKAPPPSGPHILTNIYFSNAKNLGLYSFLNVLNHVTYYTQQNVRNKWRRMANPGHAVIKLSVRRHEDKGLWIQTAESIL